MGRTTQSCKKKSTNQATRPANGRGRWTEGDYLLAKEAEKMVVNRKINR